MTDIINQLFLELNDKIYRGTRSEISQAFNNLHHAWEKEEYEATMTK